MPVEHRDGAAVYHLRLGDARLPLAPLMGRRISLQWAGRIHCLHCGRQTRKSFNQGHCYGCSQRLASCDSCIVRPELCHYHLGTCRQPDWGEQNCFAPHCVYLANSGGLKVGITRASQIPTRWIDQGAEAALPIAHTPSRRLAGLLEAHLREHCGYPDQTNWRAMLGGPAPALDLPAERQTALQKAADFISQLHQQHGPQALTPATDNPLQITYKVHQYPPRPQTLSLDNTPQIDGQLQGIKGQYLLLDCGTINIRRHSGYLTEFTTPA